MASSTFRIVEHRVPCQHIREYPRALLNKQEDVLQLAVKQYIPQDNTSPKEGDLTIIAAHANGFPKASSPNILTLRRLINHGRNFMSLYGWNCTSRQRIMGFKSEEYGLPTLHSKV